MEVVLSSHTIFQMAGRIGRLRVRGDEKAAAALERELDALVARADRISLGITVGTLTEIFRSTEPA